MRTSKACAVWPFLVRELHGVSGFNITTLRIAVNKRINASISIPPRLS